jgi:hypothetical protein
MYHSSISLIYHSSISPSTMDSRPHWTAEEIRAWLHYEALQEQEVERQVEAELVAEGGFGQSRERGIQGLWSRIGGDIQAIEEQYRFA